MPTKKRKLKSSGLPPTKKPKISSQSLSTPVKQKKYDSVAIGIGSVTPDTLKRVTRIYEGYGYDADAIYSPTLNNADVTEIRSTGTPIKLRTTTPRKRELSKISTSIVVAGKRIPFFAPSEQTSGYNSEEETKKIKENPRISTQDVVVNAIATLKTVRARKLMSRNQTQNKVVGGSADDIFNDEMQALNFALEELQEAAKVHAHLVAKAIGGDDENPQRKENLEITTGRTNINMYIPERLITSLLWKRQLDEINLKIIAHELCIDGKPTKVALGIDYNINSGLTISFNGLSTTNLPPELRKLMKAYLEDSICNSNVSSPTQSMC